MKDQNPCTFRGTARNFKGQASPKDLCKVPHGEGFSKYDGKPSKLKKY